MNTLLLALKGLAPLVKVQQKYSIFPAIDELLDHVLLRSTGGSHRLESINDFAAKNCFLSRISIKPFRKPDHMIVELRQILSFVSLFILYQRVPARDFHHFFLLSYLNKKQKVF